MPKKNQPGCPCCSQKCPLLGCDEAPFYIQAVDAVLGTVTLSWQGGTASELLIWTGTSTYQYPGGNDCPAVRRVPLTWALTTGGALSVSWPVGANNCPSSFDAGNTATFVYSLAGRVECGPFSATYLAEKIPPSNPYAILTGGATASATLSASPSGPQEMNRAGCCYFPCGKAPTTLNITIACAEFTYGPFPMTARTTSTGKQGGCCVYETAPGLAVDFPGTAVCPAVVGVPLSLSYDPCAGDVFSSVGCGPCDFACPGFFVTFPCVPGDGVYANGCPGTSIDACKSTGEGHNGQATFGLGTSTATCSPYSNSNSIHYGYGIADLVGWTTWTFYGGDCDSPPGAFGNGPNFTVTISEPL